MQKIRLLAITAWLAMWLSACGLTTTQSNTTPTEWVELSPGQTAGQTFTTRQAGLKTITLWSREPFPSLDDLQISLYHTIQAQQAVQEAIPPLASQEHTGSLIFQFSPQSDPAGQDYYLEVLWQGHGPLALGMSSSDPDLQGAMYLDRQPQAGRLIFTPDFDTLQAILGWLEFTWQALLLLAAGALLITPGWVLGAWALPRWDQYHLITRLACAAGLSVGLYPLLLLWAHLLGLTLGAWLAWGPVLVSLIVVVWQIVSQRSNFFRRMPASDERVIESQTPASTRSGSKSATLALGATILLVIISRVAVLHAIDYPLWGDGYHHTLITQLLINNGGLFQSWAPYSELPTFTYHYGFHSFSAALAWITGLETQEAVLWGGQILNILAVVVLAPLAIKLGRSPWSATMAILVAGLLVPMPMSYLNWSRFTQLAGQVILPVSIFISWEILEARAVKWQSWLIAALPWAGLALTHLRVLIFAILFLPVFLLFGHTRDGWKARLAGMVRLGGIAGLLYLPWLLRVFGGNIWRIFRAQVTTSPSQAGAHLQESQAIGNLATYLPIPIWILLAASLIFLLWRNHRPALVVAGWWLLVWLVANPQWLGLPGAGVLSNFAVFIAAYLPAGVLIGAVGGLILSSGNSARPTPGWDAGPVWHAGAALIVLLLGLWGTQQRFQDLQLEAATLVTRADLRAVDWIEANTPPAAHFLVNSFLAFGDTTAVGADAGWWLPYLAGRPTSLPPATYLFESEPWPGYREEINSLVRLLHEKGPLDPEVRAELAERGIEYVYIGQQQGQVNAPERGMLDPRQLSASVAYQLTYHQDRVWIFEVLP